jgi:hypothetical protein
VKGTAASLKRRAERALGRSVRQCPICESTDLRYEFIVDGYPVCRCADCQLLFLNPQPQLTTCGGGAQHPLALQASIYALHEANAASRLDHLTAYAGTSLRRILIVADDGFLQAEAERRHLDVTLVSSFDVNREGLKVLHPGSFDAVIFHCTLERLADPEAALRAARQGLVAAGVMTVVAATIDSRTARLFRSAWWEFNASNLHYFSADTLQSLLLKCGFGDPIIGLDDSAVSLEYFRAKVPAISSGFWRGVMRVIAGATPSVLRRSAFRRLNSRRVIMARSNPTHTQPKLSVVVPAYNEKATLPVLMERLLAKSIPGVDIEIVLVESNSTDGTREEAQRFGAHPRVRLILQDRARGKGNAVRRALAECTGHVVLIQDADLEYDIEDYDDLIAPVLAYQRNFVIGSRHVSDVRTWKIRHFNESTHLAAIYNLGHVFFLMLFNMLYRQRLKDPFSMFKVFRRDCLYGLSFECNRFDFDFEIVIKLLRKGYQPIEIPVNYQARSPSEGKKVSMIRDPLTWVRALVKFRWSKLYSTGT